MSINLHSLELKNMLKFSIVEISQLLGSLDFFFFRAASKEWKFPNAASSCCSADCLAQPGSSASLKTSRNAKVGLREHDGLPLQAGRKIFARCLRAGRRGEERRGSRGDTPCSLPLNRKSSHLTSFQGQLAGRICVFKRHS